MGSDAAVLYQTNMEAVISGIVANLSTTNVHDIGGAMATMWTYPDDSKSVIPLPLTRFTSFTMSTGDSSVPKCKKAIVTAKVSRGAYGAMKAVVLEVTEVIDE